MEKYQKAKPRTTLWWIGVWATVWWGVTCLYIALLVWSAREVFVTISGSKDSAGFWSDWSKAISRNYQAEKGLRVLAIIILAVWAVGAYIWLAELKRDHVSYKAALKDLFLTIRK